MGCMYNTVDDSVECPKGVQVRISKIAVAQMTIQREVEASTAASVPQVSDLKLDPDTQRTNADGTSSAKKKALESLHTDCASTAALPGIMALVYFGHPQNYRWVRISAGKHRFVDELKVRFEVQLESLLYMYYAVAQATVDACVFVRNFMVNRDLDDAGLNEAFQKATDEVKEKDVANQRLRGCGPD